MRYPLLEIDLNVIYDNAVRLKNICTDAGIEPYAVIKGYNALNPVSEAIVEAGYTCLGSSRLPHLRRVRERGLPVRTLALRIPMPSEVEDLVRWCDISLNSEFETLKRIDAEAASQKRPHNVILMRDLGDLREGIFDRDVFRETAVRVERELPHLHLLGIGSNLSCYGTARPTGENLAWLAEDAAEIERQIGRKLDVVSGGASTSLTPLIRGEMPQGINNLRIGAPLLYRPAEDLGLAEHELTEIRNAFTLHAEIVELNEKPTHPIGELGLDCFGNSKTFTDRGVRRRALVAVGAFDIGSHDKLLPLDPDIETLGCSSDHMIVDIHNSERAYALGDPIAFRMLYQAILFTTENALVAKKYVRGGPAQA